MYVGLGNREEIDIAVMILIIQSGDYKSMQVSMRCDLHFAIGRVF
jgi:hypothetical protein